MDGLTAMFETLKIIGLVVVVLTIVWAAWYVGQHVMALQQDLRDFLLAEEAVDALDLSRRWGNGGG